MPDKKQHEKKVFQLFKNLIDDFPKGKVIHSESPDFLLRLNPKKTIGIELTELRGQTFHENQGHFENPGLLFQHIENTISAKEEKTYLYQKIKPVELWLLIHIQSFHGKLNFLYRNKLSNWSFNSSFDRIYLLEIKNKNLHRIC